MSPIISIDELKKLKDFVLIDASNHAAARANYEQSHLEDALFVDVNSQLAHIKQDLSQGGRHPLPTPEAFSKTLMQLGISPHTHVIVYDDKNGTNAAARFWWMLKAAGHDKVQVLDGGLQAAQKAGYPMESGIGQARGSASYRFDDWKLALADMSEVESASQDEAKTIIDVRESARYKGETEPIDLIAGHIPNALNIPFSENLNSEGLFLKPSELHDKYKDFVSGNTIIHCGSGITACHTILAMVHAGLEIPKLYVGSWSEWSRNGLPTASSN